MMAGKLGAGKGIIKKRHVSGGSSMDLVGVHPNSGGTLIRLKGTVNGRWCDVPTLGLVVSVIL